MNQNQSWDVGGQEGNSYPFDTIGAYVKLKVTNYEPNLPQTHMTGELAGKPRTFDSGAPMLMHRVTGTIVDADQKHKVGEEASFYLKGAKKLDGDAGSTQAVVSAAILAATGATTLQWGGTVTLQYVADKPSTVRGLSPSKLYKAWYEVPSFAPVGEAAPGPTAPPASTAAAPPSAPAPAASAAAPGLTAEQMAEIARLTAVAQAPQTPAQEVWEADPRVAQLRAAGTSDAIIRQVLGI